MPPAEKKTPFDSLSDQQRERLAKLTSSIQHDKLTVSFMIEERNPDWGKRSAFYSVTASRDPGATQTEDATSGWSSNDLKVVRCLLCKHVVTATYDDAVKRRIMTVERARDEVVGIAAAYDTTLAKHLLNGE